MATVPMKRVLTLLIVLAGAVFLPGCASTGPEDPNRVSTIPWNHPQQWEGQGPLGGFNQSR